MTKKTGRFSPYDLNSVAQRREQLLSTRQQPTKDSPRPYELNSQQKIAANTSPKSK